MGHVCADKVTCRQRAKQRQFSGHDSRSDEPCQSLGVLTRVGWMRTPHAKHLEDTLLGSKHGSSTDGANFDTRHADGH